MGPHESAAFLNGTPAGLQLGVEQVPDMDHLGPDLQVDIDVRGAGNLGELQRIVEQRVGGADPEQ